MNKIMKKLMVSLIVLTMVFMNSNYLNKVFAETNTNLNEYKDTSEVGEKLDDEHEITTMDEDGNVRSLEETEANMPMVTKKLEPRVATYTDTRISNSSTAVVNFRTKSSSQTNTYYTEDKTGRDGYTNGYYAADGAFLGYDNETNPTKVKFMQAGVVGWVNASEVEVLDYTSSAINTISKYYVKNGRVYHGISTNLANSDYGSALDCGPNPTYLKEGTEYYSYDGHYFYEGSNQSSYARMLSDYRNNSRAHSVNSSDPYYNYYQFLSHRSITTYTPDQINSAINSMVTSSEKSNGRTSKMRNTGKAFIDNQNKYGTNALLMIGVAANESAWGCSRIATDKNNLFGHAAYDSDPSGSANGYSSAEYSIYYHSSQFISKGYLDPVTDSRYYGANLGDKASGIGVKYASDPYWGEKAVAICWKIDSYLGSKDSYKYTIAIKDTINTNHNVIAIKSDAASSSNTLYSTYPISRSTTYKNYAPSNYPFIILKNGNKNNYYKIQSDGAVNSSRTGIIQSPSQSEYNFDGDYGYIPTNSVTIVSQGSNSQSLLNTDNVTGQPTGKDSSEPTILYTANSQSVGWLEEVTEPNTAGTTGRSLDLYQIKINLINIANSSKLSGKVYSNGTWVNYDSINSDTIIGNNNKALQFVNFTLNNQPDYKLQYRVHSADVGWQAWTNQGNNAGTSGKNIQAIDFRLLKDIAISSVILNKNNISLVKGNSETLIATIDPSNTTNDKTLTWTSSNPNVATVDSYGKVIAKTKGTAKITVKTSNGKSAECTVTVVEQTPSVTYQT
ncbi:glucosaminidase domain-containing protein, partial [Thomasclavelia sp.]